MSTKREVKEFKETHEQETVEMKSGTPLITTILQFKMAKKILRVTEIKREKRRERDYEWIYSSELTSPEINIQTLYGFLDKLEKEGVIEYLDHTVKKEWRGVFRLTKSGEERIRAELLDLLSSM